MRSACPFRAANGHSVWLCSRPSTTERVLTPRRRIECWIASLTETSVVSRLFLSVLNSLTDYLARRLVRPDQDGLVVIKVQHYVRINECCLIQLSDPKIGQQAT
jgi:hypothetical protein